MVSKQKVIIDTDPGVDDILAMLLAFSATPEELEVLLISLTFGNIDVPNCLRNAISLFHTIEKELAWRQKHGKEQGFETLRSLKPIVAVGAEEPLADQRMMADYFHGFDGLGGIHSSHPHLTPAETWKALFDRARKSDKPEEAAIAEELQEADPIFKPSNERAHKEMLRLLRENEKDTITIIAIGPLTNCALAAAEDPETFLRVKEVVVMGGTSLLHRQKVSANPPPPFLKPYPESLSRQLKVVLFPLDITHRHEMKRGQVTEAVKPLAEAGSPLAEWVSAFLTSTFAKIESLSAGQSGDAVGLALHDPLCVWYAMTVDDPKWKIKEGEDMRIETSGQWTRGMCVVDRRDRRQRDADDGEGEVPGDTGNWLGADAGNRIGRCVETPGEKLFASYLLRRVFGV
ncbi:hypothetical protein H2203_003180 [Taxawa tesnikishii (nom. ined.)]|nr:hypothetical protein H2203_003180 [Dothideales sp. JES 119]